MSNNIHAKWVTYLQLFPIKIVYKIEIHNKVVDTLNRKAVLVITLRGKITSSNVWKNCMIIMRILVSYGRNVRIRIYRWLFSHSRWISDYR